MVSQTQKAHHPDNFLDKITMLEARVESLERSAKLGAVTVISVDTSAISTPPTDAELDAIFGAPDSVGQGFTALINDSAGGANEYVVWSDGAAWWYIAGTKAV